MTVNETQLRRDFLDPWFKALGWDMDNSAGYAEAYRDVIHEDAIRIGSAVKAPDYCFRIGDTRKFFVEAKRPSVLIKDEIPPAYQLRRYAWSAKLALSVLSDFEEFAIYDGRVKPFKDDTAATARIFYCTFREYADKWDWIASIFSKEAVLKGAFDRFAESNRTKKGTSEVDADFLASMEEWRKGLAQNLALRNPRLTQRELNFAVQRIIDRIIFLRICEDRGIEDYGRLLGLTNGERIYPRLCQTFEAADDRYNSGLFHFKKEAARQEAPDGLTLGLTVDDKLLREFLRGLYYPDSPYEFSVISADILGQVYEQFLGKVIRLTDGHQAKVEDKPEVKKAGGVYYTPTYIVDYIVRQTVGVLLVECGSNRKQVRAAGTAVEGSLPGPTLPPKGLDSRTANAVPQRVSKLRILDPACGSGSFLIGAYQYLLNWHLQLYIANDPERWARGAKPPLVQTTRGWKLTIAERKRILLNNIFGVDIDAQAVEVTKLSLLLKVLEGETQQTIAPLFRLFHERALPDLGNNIKCGNSLIGPDFCQQDRLPLLTDEERYRLNVFDWNGPDGFRAIMKEGGFDAVIGNPPYGAFVGAVESEYFRAKFQSPANSLDSFLLFVERGSQLLHGHGLLGMIVPSGWVSAPSAKPLRALFMDTFRPTSFVSLPFDVFKAYIDTVVVTARRASRMDRDASDSVQLFVFPSKFKIRSIADFTFFGKTGNYRSWLSNPHLEFLVTCSRDEAAVLGKVRAQPVPLGDLVWVKRGIEVFEPQASKKLLVNPKPAFTGVLQRYHLDPGDSVFVSYSPEVEASKPIEYFSQPRILLRQVLSRTLRLQGVFTTTAFLTNQSVQSLIARSPGTNTSSLLALLGILNSRLVSWYFVNVNGVARRDDFPKIIIQQTRELPIPALDAPSARASHDRVVTLVEQMVKLHEQRAVARTPQEQTVLDRQISATDAQIDQLVYGLYGLTSEEIAVVEGTSSSTPVSVAVGAPTPDAKSKRGPRKKPSFAVAPSRPSLPELTPEKAYGDAAHYYCGKEDAPPYRVEPHSGGTEEHV